MFRIINGVWVRQTPIILLSSKVTRSAPTFGVPGAAGLGCAGQLWLEFDLFGEAPLEDGRDLRPL